VNGSGNVTEAFRYFYHPDHLGSTSYVTDASGEVYQHLEYFAFGETFVEEHSNTDRTPYLFNGKELDEETGLYYYGARYYDARVSVWASVDPLLDKYPATSCYIYSANNPVNFVDPNGMDVYKVNEATGEIVVTPTKRKIHDYYMVDKDGKETFVGSFRYNSKGLIKLPSSFKAKNGSGREFGFRVKEGNESRSYISGDAMASLLGALAETGTSDVTINGFSMEDGSSPSPSTSHTNGKNGDLRYLRTDRTGDRTLLGQEYFDDDRQNTLNDALFKFGWKDMISENYTPYGGGGKILLNHTSSAKARSIPTDHTNHLHLQGYAPNKRVTYMGYTLPPVTITASKIK
jgi:RHS repeat-associated protein